MSARVFAPRRALAVPSAAPGAVQARTSPARVSLEAALVPWIAARVVVALTAACAAAVVRALDPPRGAMRNHLAQWLLGWDAERYLEIASFGYEGLPLREVRFFPLLPLLARMADVVAPWDRGFALLLVSNLAALVFAAAVHALALDVSGDAALARRAAWFASIGPASFVLAWGYTEPLAGALSIAALLAARRGRWAGVALTGFAAGLTRPVGSLLAIPLVMEAIAQPRASRLRALVAACSPLFGAAAYLSWVWAVFGSPLLPYTIQVDPSFRGSPTGAFPSLARMVRAVATGVVSIDSARLLWIAFAVAMLVVLARRWPPSLAVFGVCTLLVALSASRFGSFERYVLGAPVMPLALATWAVSRRHLLATLAVLAASMAVYGSLALLGSYVP